MNDKLSNLIEILPGSLSGRVSIPPSKSLSHRAVIGASLADGPSKISNIILSDDVRSTIEGMRAFGAKIDIKRQPQIETQKQKIETQIEPSIKVNTEKKSEAPSEKNLESTFQEQFSLLIQGCDPLTPLRKNIHCRESGSTLRFLLPLAALTGEKITFTADGKLKERPLGEYYSIFDRNGIAYENCRGKLPLTIEGRLKGGAYILRGDVSSQFISGLMISLPLLDQDSEIRLTTPLESASYVEMTMDMLKRFGIRMIGDGQGNYHIAGRQRYHPMNYTVEADFSQTAFWLVAGVLSREKMGALHCENINMDTSQGDKKMVSLLKKMGARIDHSDQTTLSAYPGKLSAVDVDASDIPDIIPVLSVALAVSQGESVIYHAGRLRLKESDRLQAVVTELGKLGADIRAVGDQIHIRGKENLLGGRVDSWQDHRIAMAMAVASVACKNSVFLEGAGAVTKSYPHFFRDFKRLGGKYHGR